MKSRFGGRLEPLFRVNLVLHEGRGDLCTITRRTRSTRTHPARAPRPLERATEACDAVLRLFDAAEPNRPAYNLLCHELALLDADPPAATPRPGARVPDEAAAGRRVRPRALGLRDLRRARAPGRLLAARRRRGLPGLRGGLVPADGRGARFMVEALAKPLCRAPEAPRSGAPAGRSGDRRDCGTSRTRAPSPSDVIRALATATTPSGSTPSRRADARCATCSVARAPTSRR